MPTRDEIVAEARKWKGTKWRHQGRNEYGVDCAGLIVRVAHDLGISTYDYTQYPRRSHGLEFLRHLEEHLVSKDVRDPQIGDVGVFADPRFPCHCGIITMRYGVLYLVHSHLARRKVVEEQLDPHWTPVMTNLFEYPGVTNG